ncbi:DUF4129 domain-containing protein [Actinoplanes sp. NPDC051411]|uniref:DUF4129 domain-containing protein n=1 Tax=Actinoplanes sp. NPDC051411 TaxID=3155522 RepID=UPI0034488983
MTRDYDEFLAGVFDHLSPSVVALILLAAAIGIGLLWYTFPAWLRIHFPRIRRPRLRWRWPRWKFKRKPRRKKAKKPKAAKPEPQAATPEPEPDPEPRPQPVTLSLADRLAAEGRYAEAIRERLRESVTALTRYGVVAPAPAWTAHEVATRAGANHPAVSSPLAGATGIFSEVWYGRRPAGPDQDALMRRLTAEVKAALENQR